jgi:zinc transporter ZupT
MNSSFILMVVSASALPSLALLALLLRRNIFQRKTKALLTVLGFILFMITIGDTISEHRGELTWKDVLIGSLTALLTVYILARYSHHHKHDNHEGGAKAIVISEAFHSLLDGAVIGATYVVSPLLGYAATIGIVTHELPKIIGTITFLRGLGLSTKRTIIYGIFAQIGSPVAALLVYLLGKEFNESEFRFFEIASVSSLGAIVLWIMYLEVRFHYDHKDHNH